MMSKNRAILGQQWPFWGQKEQNGNLVQPSTCRLRSFGLDLRFTFVRQFTSLVCAGLGVKLNLPPHKNLWVNCGMGSFIAALSGSWENPPALPEVDDPRRAFDHILIARLLFDE
jgi:hypothetical protein